MPPTLVLSHRFTDDSNALWRAAIDQGWDVVRAHGFRVDPIPATPALYGETIFADAVAEALSISVLGPTSDFLPSLPQTYLGREVAKVTLAEAKSGRFPAFVKPPDDKFFPARVYADRLDLSRVTEPLAEDAEVLVSTPVRLDVEYRAFIADRSVAALSVYIRNGVVAEGWEERPGEREGALDLLTRMLADEAVSLPPAVVIDVARTEEGQWLVVEANPAWASGLCGCDPALVLTVLAKATVARGTGGVWARDAVWTSAS